jgi:predicted Zn-ribbon and HTH transcriptional regulator
MSKKRITYDKCNICGYVGKSEEFGDDEDAKCPKCGHKDIDDAYSDPYDDNDGDWGIMH